MHSFSTLTILFTAALSVFTSAAPISPFGVPSVVPVNVGDSLSTPELSGIPNTVNTGGLNLRAADTANATVAIIKPIVASIKGSIVAAIPQLQALVGQEVAIIFAPVEGEVTLTVTELAKIIGTDLCLIFTALGAVLKVAFGEVSSDVLPILIDLGCTITELLEVVVTLVGGIVAPLVPLLAPIVGVLSVLELSNFAALLGLSL
ncbi:hypothetical protein PAXRUDRAFT_275867 [Paxillus rubicundulus Ve08.2h10]|uniref:Uncharacterized protein n=1 Tax=Paxillus rubicundulus Ve08.2h10 TaxID=930991 RepID=A0A0D0EAT1_9AGAM|nr:hypothetical protein PAXRUDRAFT_275867 [Paxillus rubicundulus Ve08.2h10]